MVVHFKPLEWELDAAEQWATGKLGLDIDEATPGLSAVRDLLRIWEQRAATVGTLYREALPAEDIVPLLPYVFLAEPLERDWRYVMFGAALGSRLGVEISNKTLQQVYDAESALRVARLYERVATEGVPVGVKGQFLNQQGMSTSFEGIHVPLLENDGHNVVILGSLFFTRPAG